jgi:radical SAM protein with 4Fe4S-binding SPASM domain
MQIKLHAIVNVKKNNYHGVNLSCIFVLLRNFFHKLLKPKMTRQDVLCAMPWVHLHVTQYGTVTPCCQSPWQAQYSFGNINEATIEEIWNNDTFNAFRKGMLKGKKDVRCSRCYEKEQQGATSLRQITNKKYLDRASERFDALKPPVYFDIRFSNACNLKCRICGPWSSSSWYNDAVELGMIDKTAKALTYAIKDSASFFKELAPILIHAEEFYFAGGEPLMMQEHYDILEMLLKLGKTDVRLTYNTNFSSLSYKNYDVVNLWKQFRHVTISASLDASSERGELLRKNLVWSKVVENRQTLLTELKHIEFTVTPTLNSYNVFHLPDFHKEWHTLNFIGVEDFVIGLLIQPEALNIANLPRAFKEKCSEKYEAHVLWMQDQKYGNPEKFEFAILQYRNVSRILQSNNTHNLMPDAFKEHIQKLDKVRLESTLTIFPELKTLFN